MSLPDENLRALKRTHEFMRSIPMNKNSFRKMTAAEFKEWRTEAYYCIKHYPFDYQLDELYKDEVCQQCGMAGFHKMDCSASGVTQEA